MRVLVFCVKMHENLNSYPRCLYSTAEPPDEITVHYRHGLPLIILTLPSRRERCQFVVRPMLSTVGSFLQDIQNEDKGVKTAAVFTADGNEIPASTLMDVLLMKDFKLVINKTEYDVQCPQKEKSKQYVAHDLPIESRANDRLVHKHVKARIEARSEAKTRGLLWAGLALLSVQGGALAWFTWWVYSWDIMEPVTYFLTFTNSMIYFAYFILTRQNYTYTLISRRQLLQFFHKKSEQQHFDVEQYNKLKDDLATAKEALKRVRHSLYLKMQVEELSE
ncbi:LOW QUALITY PROTEIN: calcium uniporter regulatory subunit MCUb, mitochondrial [Marmota marmota marmota]|uniref:LOW QUALITY PROTEIN: calcium uniporter regulatory subunit MCUb, mitochondrial n=1 Tax=Marmota marmota marmota TaxID=9994 RepID=UPI002092A44E|nr:LOW QUALITY PROTEIN: calcium uniporter regulatory subunit MCUb, mitochondrial [Marmota marmota marmota]